MLSNNWGKSKTNRKGAAAFGQIQFQVVGNVSKEFLSTLREANVAWRLRPSAVPTNRRRTASKCAKNLYLLSYYTETEEQEKEEDDVD